MSDPYHFRYLPPCPLTHDPSSTMMPQPALLGHKQRFDSASDVRWTPQSSSGLDLHPYGPYHTVLYKRNSNDLPNSDSRRRRRRRVDDRGNVDHLLISRFTTRYPLTPSQKDAVRVCGDCFRCVQVAPSPGSGCLARRREERVIPSLASSPSYNAHWVKHGVFISSPGYHTIIQVIFCLVKAAEIVREGASDHDRAP